MNERTKERTKERMNLNLAHDDFTKAAVDDGILMLLVSDVQQGWVNGGNVTFAGWQPGR